MKTALKKSLSVLLSFTLIASFITSLGSFDVCAAQSSVLYNFEGSGGTGDLMNWEQDYNYTPSIYTVDASQHWMKESVNFPTQKDGAVHAILGDLSGYQAIEYDLYVPNPTNLSGSLSVGTAIKYGSGWTWADVGEALNIADITKAPIETIAGTPYAHIHVSAPLSGVSAANLSEAKAIVLKLYSDTLAYTGDVYYDNVKLVSTNDTVTPTGILYNFDNGTLGFSGSRGGATAFSVNSTPAQFDSGNKALQLDVAFDSTKGWSDGTIESTQFSGDWSNHNAVQYEVLIPDPTTFTGGLKLKSVVKVGDGWTWTDIGEKDFTNSDITSLPTVTVNSKVYGVARVNQPFPATLKASLSNVKSLNFQVAGDTSSYGGALYFDNINIVQGDISSGGQPTVNLKPITRETFNFEDGTVMGWKTGWGGYLGTGGVTYSSDLSRTGNTGSLKLDLNMPNTTSFDEANIVASLDGLAGDGTDKVDLTPYQSIDYDVYIPDIDNAAIPTDAQFKIRTALDKSWATLQDYTSFKISDIKRVVIGGKTYGVIHVSVPIGDSINRKGSEVLAIGLSGYKCPISGPIYIDDIKLVYPTSFTLIPTNFSPEDIITGTKSLTVKPILPQGKKVSSIYLLDAKGNRVDFMASGDSYAGSWDTTKDADGFQNITLYGQTTDGDTFTKSIETFVKNSGTTVAITAPSSDSTVKNTVTVTAAVGTVSASIDSVTLSVNGKQYAMTLSGSSYAASLDTKILKDGVHTLQVTAKDSQGYTVQANEEIMVSNEGTMSSFVKRQGTQFMLDGKQFNFVGTNMYDLPFLNTNTLASNNKVTNYTEDGRAIYDLQMSGQTFTFDQQVDREMDEMNKLGMTTLRTWAFNFNKSDSNAFVDTGTSTWTNREAEFQKLDYIMDSAARHNIRVMLTLQNYWNDYGGIQAVTNNLGLSSKLEFFTNSDAKTYFKSYFNDLATRVNTINGKTYKNDPAVFAWDLMNEARIDQNDDGGNKNLDDPTGSKLSAWINEMSTYAKSIDANHLVTVGAEGHGFPNACSNESLKNIWGGVNEGYSNNPIAILNQPNIDFFSIHPYPNASWLNYSLNETKNLITGYVTAGLKAGKPVVMQEYGVDSQAALKDPNNQDAQVLPTASGYSQVRQLWYQEMLSTFRNAGGAGSLVWMLSSKNTDQNYSLAVYSPSELVARDRGIINILSKEAVFSAAIAGTSKPSVPVITVSGNTVTIKTNSEGADIFYTTDGSAPSLSSTLYTGPFTISKGAVIHAIVYKNGIASDSVTFGGSANSPSSTPTNSSTPNADSPKTGDWGMQIPLALFFCSAIGLLATRRIKQHD